MTKVIEKHEFLHFVDISLDQLQKRKIIEKAKKRCNCYAFLTKMLIVDIHVCPKRYYSLCFSLIWNSSPEPSGTGGSEPFAPVRDLLNTRRRSG